MTKPHVRHIRASVPRARLAEVAQFWVSSGRSLIESAPGCLGAQGFIDNDASEFVLFIRWRSEEDGERFRLSQEHEEKFVVPLGEDVVRLSRAHLEPLDE